MWVATRHGPPGLETPHLHGGTDLDKAAWEASHASELWLALRPYVSPEDFADREVIDIGCGWGGKTVVLAETTQLTRITGFDLPGVFKPEVAKAFADSRGVSNCSFTTGLAEAIPFADGTFDLAFMDDVLEHVQDPARVLQECRRVLRSEGLLIARFPSLRMLRAHHFDRALTSPGLHYVMPMRRWAAGFNYFLLRNRAGISFEPFSEVVDTPYAKGVTRNLNGLDFNAARHITADSGFQVRTLECVSFPNTSTSRRGKVVRRVYSFARAIPALNEILANTIVLVAVRP